MGFSLTFLLTFFPIPDHGDRNTRVSYCMCSKACKAEYIAYNECIDNRGRSEQLWPSLSCARMNNSSWIYSGCRFWTCLDSSSLILHYQRKNKRKSLYTWDRNMAGLLHQIFRTIQSRDNPSAHHDGVPIVAKSCLACSKTFSVHIIRILVWYNQG